MSDLQDEENGSTADPIESNNNDLENENEVVAESYEFSKGTNMKELIAASRIQRNYRKFVNSKRKATAIDVPKLVSGIFYLGNSEKVDERFYCARNLLHSFDPQF